MARVPRYRRIAIILDILLHLSTVSCVWVLSRKKHRPPRSPREPTLPLAQHSQPPDRPLTVLAPLTMGDEKLRTAAATSRAVYMAGEIPSDVHCTNHYNLPMALFLRSFSHPSHPVTAASEVALYEKRTRVWGFVHELCSAGCWCPTRVESAAGVHRVVGVRP